MPSIRRTRTLDRLRKGLALPSPAVIVVTGGPRTGKSSALRAVLGQDRTGQEIGRHLIAVRGAPGPTSRHLRVLADTLRRGGIGGEHPCTSWSEGFEPLREALEGDRVPRVLILDEVHHLHHGSPELGLALARLWTGARARALPLRLVLVSSDSTAVDQLVGEGGPLESADPHTVTVDDLSTAEIREHLDGWSPRDRFLLQACLGRSPSTIGLVDPDVRLSTNLHRLVFDPEGRLHGQPIRHLERRIQKPRRYVGILGAMAEGAQDWRSIHAANPAFSSGNQLAPYMSTLQDLGWVEAERSLDAPPRARKRRYHIADPLVAFWYGVVEPALGILLEGKSAASTWRGVLAGRRFARHASAVFPRALHRVLAENGDDLVGARARQIGGLWGDGYDLAVAGTLRNGAALYGTAVWGRIATVADAAAVHGHMRATRYGFGREARLRVVFAAAGATEGLTRAVARDELLLVVPLEKAF